MKASRGSATSSTGWRCRWNLADCHRPRFPLLGAIKVVYGVSDRSEIFQPIGDLPRWPPTEPNETQTGPIARVVQSGPAFLRWGCRVIPLVEATPKALEAAKVAFARKQLARSQKPFQVLLSANFDSFLSLPGGTASVLTSKLNDHIMKPDIDG